MSGDFFCRYFLALELEVINYYRIFAKIAKISFTSA